VATYRPNQAVREQLAGCHVVAVVGPTAAGKTTLIDAALGQDSNLHLILSDMSRAPRPGECDGRDAHFRSRTQMLDRKARQEYVNVTEGLNGGDVYATAPENFPRQGVGIMPLFADVVPEFRALPFASFKTVYILPSSWDVWQTRLDERAFTPDQRRARFVEAVRSLQFAVDDLETILVVNDDLRAATADFVRVLQPGPVPASVQAGQVMARKLALDLYKQLQIDLNSTK
jgi:guanylate kinase